MRAEERARRPKPAKLAGNGELHRWVRGKLVKNWSPEQICARLAVDFPDRPEMRVSHETIYRALYVEGRGAMVEAGDDAGEVELALGGSDPGFRERGELAVPVSMSMRALKSAWATVGRISGSPPGACWVMGGA